MGLGFTKEKLGSIMGPGALGLVIPLDTLAGSSLFGQKAQ